MESIAEMLHTYGGWGVAAVSLGIIFVMARYIAQLHKGQRDDTREVVTVLEGFKAAVEALSKSSDRLADEISRKR